MSGALDAFTVVAVCAGALFFLAGSVGLLRFPDAASRIHALTKAGDRVKVVTGLDGMEQGVYLEQLLEKHLRIEDRPVADEHRG